MSSTRPARARNQTQSLFFRDIASPISSTHYNRSGSGSGKFITPTQAATVSALWKENFPSSSSTSPPDLPPPPIFTLDDRASDFSPEALDVLPPASPLSPEFRRSDSRPPSRSPAASAEKNQEEKVTSGSGSWWSPGRSGEVEKAVGSPVDGVVQNGALVMFPPPSEVVRPEVRKENLVSARGLDEEEWVTVYGFSPVDTNLVLREFEKCGMILKNISGPRDANWMHILYQNRYDAQKALAKNGVQINNVLIVGVKLVDPTQRKPLDNRYDAQKALAKNGVQINNVLIVGVKLVDPTQRKFLNEKFNSTNQGFMFSFPPSANGRKPEASTSLKPSSKPYPLQSSTGSISDIGRRSEGAIATPAKSVISKAMDLMFGL